ncbi:hypothetical protein AB0O64_05660 [Streptomyces sp. NPDC088341]|uniref:hypothetical protein n=1 Tax=Streptomyces sp. NPDC088341 TaxID=3154870 RepID=UPI003443626B
MAEIDKIIGDRIERGRRRRGLYQHELAAAVGHAALVLDLVEQVQHGDTLRRVTELHRSLGGRGTGGTRGLSEHLVETRTQLKAARSAA